MQKIHEHQQGHKAGYNVGCIHQPVGNVTVKNGQNVTFQAGGYIDVVSGGFNTELGAVFEARIAKCGDVPTNALNDTNLLFYSNAAFFTCDGGHNNAIFTSTGFSYYRVRIFNRWGVKVLDQMGHIDEIFTLYASGAEIYTDISQGVFTVQLELFNCSYSKLEAFSLTYTYVDPCVSAYFKTDPDISSAISNYENKDDEDVKLYPNPSSDVINLCYTVYNNETVHFAIYDQLGRNVYEKENIEVANKNQLQVISTNKLSNGIYFLALYKDGKKYLKKFIIQK